MNGALPKLHAACSEFSELRRAVPGADADVFCLAQEGRLALRIPIVAGRPSNPRLISPLNGALIVDEDLGQVLAESAATSMAEFLTGAMSGVLFAWTARVRGALPRLSVAEGTFGSLRWRRAVNRAGLTSQDVRAILTWIE